MDDLVFGSKITFKQFAAILAVTLALYAFAFAPATQPVAPQQYSGNASVEVHFFYHPSCPHCKEQMPINQIIAEEYPFAAWKYHNIDDEGALFREMLAERGRGSEGVPTTIINDTVIVGFDSKKTPDEIRLALAGAMPGSSQSGHDRAEIRLPFVGAVQLSGYSLPALAIVLGLIDGFNPCAMWVLVYLITITLTMQNRQRLWLLVGTFLLASGVLYFLIMSAWFNAFLLVGYLRPVMIAVGAFAIYWGAASLEEFVKSKGNIACKMEDAAGKKDTMGKVDRLLTSPMTIATLAGIVALAFTINSIEFVCSSAIPAVFTQVPHLAILARLSITGTLRYT